MEPFDTARADAAVMQMAAEHFVGDRLYAMLAHDRDQVTTSSIKDRFGALGISLGYRVAASGCRFMHEPEYLYDLTWHLTNEYGRQRQVLALESELRPGTVNSVANVHRNFQKLVQARTDVRVWLAAIHNSNLLTQHLDNCKQQTMRFAGSLPGDHYIFILFDWTARTTLIEPYVVPGRSGES